MTVRRVLVALAAALLLAAAAWWAFRPERPQTARATLSLTGTLGGADTAGYARATEPRPFDFPADHAPHPDFRTEWWYVTGNVATADGRAFGYQLTLFRNALAPPSADALAPGTAAAGSAAATPSTPPSAWATRQAWMGHLAVTDVAAGRHVAEERFDRGALGLAGGQAAPFRVWLEDWALEGEGDGAFPLHLVAPGDSAGLDLVLEPEKPVVLQGDHGLSRKGPEPGNASYYYSFTRLGTRGQVRVGGRTYAVRGSSWLDREWSTSALPEGTVGWDWFALQLDGGTDLMLYRLRRADGGVSPFSDGVLVAPDGVSRRLPPDAWTVDVTARWRSPDGATYPSAWRVRIPGAGLDLTVRSRVPDQEWRTSFRYWEGTVRVEGTGPGGPVGGLGYAELTGYAEGGGAGGPGGVRGAP